MATPVQMIDERNFNPSLRFYGKSTATFMCLILCRVEGICPGDAEKGHFQQCQSNAKWEETTQKEMQLFIECLQCSRCCAECSAEHYKL